MTTTYDFKPGDEVYIGRMHGVGEVAKVEKVSRGFAVVNGLKFRMNGSRVGPTGYHTIYIEPLTDAIRMTIRHTAAAEGLAGTPAKMWSRLPTERLEALLAEVQNAAIRDLKPPSASA